MVSIKYHRYDKIREKPFQCPGVRFFRYIIILNSIIVEIQEET